MSQTFNNARPEIKQRLTALAVASACAALSIPAFAQDAGSNPGGSPATTDVGAPAAAAPAAVVQVTGIRASMQSTLNLKRNSDGIVDGIVADDIGKFPDTNLAEAVQRISGVSIDRTNGEGQRVTVRGIGPDFNLILLNGRQMPSANLDDRGSRSFDFSNLASEAISQIQVYKSQRADTPAGGVGATLNIMTGRPLDLGNQTSIGAKVDYDKSNMNLPDQLGGKKLTPEVSFLLSRKFGKDDMFGVSLTGSYQSRNSGEAQAQVPNGYLGPYAGTNTGSLVNSKGITGISGNQLYDTPQNLSYSLNGTQRQRTNAQLTFQFRPTKDWTNTLDYTYARNKQQVMDNSLNVWFSGKNVVSGANFVNGPVQSPSTYTENYGTGGNAQDLDMVANDSATVSTLKSVGFNSQLRVNSSLKLSFDIHHSTSEAGADSPYGTATDLSVASFGRNANTLDLTHEMPVLSVDYTPSPFQVSGSWFQDAHVKQTIDQVQAGGSLKIGQSSNLNFGLGHIKTGFNSAWQQVEQDSWTGTINNRAATAQYFNQANFTPINYTQYFSKLGGSGSPALFPTMWLLNFPGVRQDVINATSQTNNPDVQHIDASKFSPSLANPSELRSLTEKTNSLYGQFNTDWDTAMPMHTGVGLRYEKTTVDTAYTIAVPASEGWISQNEFPITLAPGVAQTQSADYHYWLPTVDWDMDVTPGVKLRASWGVSIGRPRWDQIQGGTSYNGGNASIRGETGTAGNPALLPVKSRNIDLSAEWYYSKHSMVSLGLFNKSLSGYAGTTIQNQTSPNVTTPVGGAYWNAAVANGNCGTDTFCIRDYIFNHFNGQPGVTGTGLGPDGVHQAGNIVGQPGDPKLPLLITTTTNSNSANVKGAEINWQHMFDNGFGFQTNYTYVKSGLHYDTASANTTQFAMVGLANSANLVGIYENDKLSVRLAYNWRGEFLNSTAAFNQPEPGFTEAYGQVDLSVGYNLTKNVSLSLEAINLTNSTQRIHARDSNEVLSAIQFGPRYMIGARYKF